MQQFEGEAIVLTSLPHGEHGAIVRFLTLDAGLRAGYVAGARGKAKRALLHPGNRVFLQLRARSTAQLAAATLELVESRVLAAMEPTPATILSYLAALSATTLAEEVPHPQLAQMLDTLLGALAGGVAPLAARAGLLRYELQLLEESGLGLDLAACALGGDADDLAFVSPHTGRAVSRAKALGQPWEHRLLPLPAFLRQGAAATPAEIVAAADLLGHFLHRHWPSNPALTGLRARALGRLADRP